MQPALQQAQNANLQQQNYAQGQSNAYQGEVGNDVNQTQAQLGNLQNYQQSLQRPENQGANIYSQQLGQANSLYGVNPRELQQAQQTLAQTQDVMAALPQAIQQGANGRMVTGAQEASRYAQAAGGVQQQLTNQTNAIGQLQQGVGYAQNAAQQGTTAQQASQQMQLGALQNIYQDALQKQQQAQSQVQYFQTLRQQGYNVTANLQNAQAAMISAQAAAQQAATGLMQANFQIQQTQGEEQALQAKYGNSAPLALAGITGGMSAADINTITGIQRQQAAATPVATPGVNWGQALQQGAGSALGALL